ncbi:hypothetical protein Pla144_23260 [Bythopirellula polymerisocia]|uniref:Uncharacterized protein n=1 Tax=Bythopirellula polymerisocia TaxID=2528003 RepID=A0A5C6CY23_9BACT|nr:hypothetical protein Pla144_23260 [Bythopirellula polymerisocia]
MRVWIILLRVFAYFWLTASLLLILSGIAGIWMKGGLSAIQGLLSPFNIVNWIVTAITLAPGVGALAWADKLSSKDSNTP